VLVLLGGRGNNNERFSTAEMLELRNPGSWLQVPSMGSKRSMCVAVVYDNDLWVFGGYDGHTCLDTAEFFDSEEQKWVKLPNLTTGRCAAGTVLDDRIYIVGGYSVTSPMVCLDSVEVFNPLTQLWEEPLKLSQKRSRLGVAAVGGLLYAVGGSAAASEYSSSIEAYNPPTGIWIKVPNMQYKRAYPAVAAIGVSHLLVAGGDTGGGSACMDSVELFDTATQTWCEVAPMSAARTAASAVACNEAIYVLGGYNATVTQQRFDLVESYDIKSNQWHEVASMNEGRSHHMTVRYSQLTGKYCATNDAAAGLTKQN